MPLNITTEDKRKPISSLDAGDIFKIHYDGAVFMLLDAEELPNAHEVCGLVEVLACCLSSGCVQTIDANLLIWPLRGTLTVDNP